MSRIGQYLCAASCGLGFSWLSGSFGIHGESTTSALSPTAPPPKTLPGSRAREINSAIPIPSGKMGDADSIWNDLDQALLIPDESLPEAPALILKLSDNAARRWLTLGLYTRWAEIDAQAALKNAATLPKPLDFNANQAVMLVLARRDPIAALKLTKEMTPAGWNKPNSGETMGPSCPVLAEWARIHPNEAMTYVLNAQRQTGEDAFDDSTSQKAFRQQTYTVVAVWMESDPLGFAAWFRNLPDSMERRFVARRVPLAGQRFGQELTEALAVELPGSGIGRRAGFYAVVKALKNPDESLTMLSASHWTWETGLAFADMDGSTMGAVPPAKVQVAATSLLERMPEGPAANGIRCGAAIRSQQWPEAAAVAGRFPESSERAAVWRQIITGWVKTDQPAAEAWLATQPKGYSREYAASSLGKSE
jgi:hypothetical protein